MAKSKTDKLRDKVVEAYQESEENRQPREDRWKEFYRQYRSYIKEEDKKENRANLFIPYIFSIVETVVPRLTGTIFDKRPFVKPLPREPQDIESAEALELLLDYQFDKMSFRETASDWFKQALMYGSAVVKVTWRQETKTVVEKEQVTPKNPAQLLQSLQGDEPLVKEKSKEVTEYDQPFVELVDIFDFYPDPYAESIEDARYVVHKTNKSMEHLKNMQQQGIYENVDEIEKSNSFKQLDNNSMNDRLSDIGLANQPNNEDGMVEILEYWEEDRVITIANREVVLRDSKNPYHHKQIPFVKIDDSSVPKEFWGIGEIEPNEKLQAELNTTRNQRIDNISMSINNMYAAVEGKVQDEDLENEPGGIIWVQGTSDINKVLQPIPKPKISPSAYQEEEQIKSDMENASGVHDYVKGKEPSGSATATEITSLQRESNHRFQQKIRNMLTGVKKVGELMVQLDQQFIETPQMLRLTGDRKTNFVQPQQFGNNPVMEETNYKFVQLQPQDIVGQFDIKVSTAALEALADKQVKRQQLLEAMQVIGQQAGTASIEMIKQILKTYDIKAVDKIVDELDRKIKQMEQQKMMKQQQQMQQQQPKTQNTQQMKSKVNQQGTPPGGRANG